VFTLELLHTLVHKTFVEVLSSQVGVTSGSLNLKDTVFDGKQRYVEGTATQVIDEDIALTFGLLVQSLRDGCRCGFVDDAQTVESRDLRSVLGGLSLRVVELSWYGDHRLNARLTQLGLRCLLHFD